MAKKANYDDFISSTLSLIGGRENVVYLTHCVTRLRFNVKDRTLVKEEEIRTKEGVLGLQWQGEQLQIIIGPNVREVYEKICAKTGLGEAAGQPSDKGRERFSFNALIDTIAGCITPAIPVMIGAGMLKVILLVCTMSGILTAESGTYVTLNFVSDTAFYFLPVYVGAASARKFGSNMWLGIFFGAMLIHPSFTAMCGQGSGGSIFGLPIYAATYSASVFPAILSVFFASRLEKFFTKIVPAFLKAMLVPFLTILITTPVTLCILGPIGAFIGIYLAEGMTWLFDTTGFFCMAVTAALYPLLVMTGTHHAVGLIGVQNITSMGYDPFVLVLNFINNLNQGAACLAVAFKSKNVDNKSEAVSSGVTAIVCGVTEPALYGTILKNRTPLYAAMIGNFAGGTIAGLLHVCLYAFAGSWGLFGLPAFIGEKANNLLYMILTIIVGMIVTFVVTLLIFKEKKE